jgi:hypothetical protein
MEMCFSKSGSYVADLVDRLGALVKLDNRPSGGRVGRFLITQWSTDWLPAKSRALDSRAVPCHET